ncbi:hypothetical protein ACTFIR_005764 [Dictyostelium discoideum]
MRTCYNTLIENRSSKQINKLFKNMHNSFKVIENETRGRDGLIGIHEAVDARANAVYEGLCVTTTSWNSEHEWHDIQTDLITMNREAKRFHIGDMEFDSMENVQNYYADKYIQPPKDKKCLF